MESFPDPFSGPTHDGSLSKDALNYQPHVDEEPKDISPSSLPLVKGKGLFIPSVDGVKTSANLPLPWIRPANAAPVDFTGEAAIPPIEEKPAYGPDVLIDNMTGLPFRRHINKYGAGDSMKATKEALDKFRGNSNR